MSASESNEEHSMMSCVVASRSIAWEKRSLRHERLFTIVMSLKRKRSDLSIKDKNIDVDDIVFQMICKSVVLQLNVVFLIYSVLLDFALH